MEAQLRQGGAAEAVIEATVSRYADDEKEFEVYEENWGELGLFIDLGTQWRQAVGMGGMVWLGFDYSGVKTYLDMAGVEDRERVFLQLQLMEAAALPVLNRSKK
ncbi:MAG: DUF1799 domain-containing protein [Burkholderiales bacterium]|nr:DUF1799 domain-containing protein [Burkholderiales bacterium]